MRTRRYTENIVRFLKWVIVDGFPGLGLHGMIAILVPDAGFRGAMLRGSHLAGAIAAGCDGLEVELVSAEEGATAGEQRKKKSAPIRVILDTVDAFDGMERMIVLAVGLDTVRTVTGCSMIYRAMTRAHMLVGVIQEHTCEGLKLG